MSSNSPAMQSLIAEAQNLDTLIHSIDIRDVRRVVRQIVAADKVIIVGYKMSASLAEYLHNALKESVDNTVAVTTATGQFQEELVFATSKSVVIAISFPRYTRAVVRDFRQAHERGVRTVAVTDSELSPLAEHAAYRLLAPCQAVSYVDAFAAAVALLCAIATEVTVALEGQLVRRLGRLEDLWSESELFFS